tara:strand:+ start:995 stop:1627 length:633 start_codon:yes stop_codon:yes gene_type:complete
LDVYKTEEEQVEAIKKWWNENGKSIIVGIVVGITAIFGWRGYEARTATQAKAASILYEQLILASRKGDKENMREISDDIIRDFGSSTYAIFSKLMLAKLESESSNFESAEEHLKSILNDSTRDEFKHIARLRLVRVLMANNKLEDAIKLITSVNTGQFFTHYEELRGDILVKQGNKKEAAQAYQNALSNTLNSEESESMLQMKLDDLGRI